MKKIDRERFGKAMAVLGEVFDKAITAGLLEVYFYDLRQFSIGVVEKAALQLRRTCKYFPRPAEFVELLEGTLDEQALLAWDSVVMALSSYGDAPVKFEDGATGAAVNAIGGWIRLCNSSESDLPFLKKEFVQFYKIFWKRGDNRPVTLRGRYKGKPKLIPSRCGGNLLLRSGEESDGKD